MEEDLKYISDALEVADKFGVAAEVVYFAIKAMKEDSFLDIQQAIEEGLNEWVK